MTVTDTGVNPLSTTKSSVDRRPKMDASFSGKSDTVINIHPTDKEAVENWRLSNSTQKEEEEFIPRSLS